jgi:hypothetical protein
MQYCSIGVKPVPVTPFKFRPNYMKHGLMRGTTYSHRVTVKEMTVEELHRTMETWLRLNSCTIKESRPPRSITAYFPANGPMYNLGLRDIYPKNIEVNMNSFGSSATMNITFTQELPRVGEAGFLYWGSRLERLYRKLGVPLDSYAFAELYPPEWVNRVIQRTLNLYAAYTLASLAIIYLGFLPSPDLVATYTFVIFMPITLMAGLDINDHRKLLNKMKYK